ncbi:MAG: anthranilate synthase component I family protein [Planctomycetota bacterium]
MWIGGHPWQPETRAKQGPPGETPSPDPLDVVAAWPTDRPLGVLLSGRHHPTWSRWSVVAEPCETHHVPVAETPGDPSDPLSELDRIAQNAGDDLLLCAVSYDAGRSIESIPSARPPDRDWPAVYAGRCRAWACHDRPTGRWSLFGSSQERQILAQRLAAAHRAQADAESDTPATRFQTGPPVATPADADHEAAVARAIERIAQGDVFQVNLARRITREFQGDPRALFHAVARAAEPWFGAWLELDPPGAATRRGLASASPELFLDLTRPPAVVSRPIKGTRPNPGDADPRAAAERLRDSPKDRAELAMIVDLVRNDLGRVAQPGSVRVDEARRIEAHPTVWQAVATVSADLRPGLNAVDALRAALPPGSVIGAPKVQAMQLIESLEPARRGPYCGVVGWMHQGRSAWSVAIRTLALEVDRHNAGRIDQWVGGGVVADSTPQGELLETRVKAAAIDRALHSAGAQADPAPARKPAEAQPQTVPPA